MKIGVLGIGKLGLCFALNLERAGHTVTGVDVSDKYITALNNKTFTSNEPEVNDLLAASEEFTATSQLKDIVNDDIALIFVAVATPSLANGAYDHTQIERVTNELIKHGIRKNKTHIVICCTVMPGYCSKLSQKLKSYNYTVTYNPEFIAQGSIIHDQLFPDQILIGEEDPQAGNLIEEIYQHLCRSKPVICRMNLLSAEIAKIATNCFLTTKISFANSIGDLATQAGAEPDKILQALGADSRIGSKYLKYGFGFGGPCFPRDNRALGLFASQSGFQLHISEATDEVNQQHLQFQFEQYLQAYPDNETIIINGVAYKAGTFILEESQPLALALKLAEAGRSVLIREQKDVVNELMTKYGTLFSYEIVTA